MGNEGQAVDRLPVDQDGDPHQVAAAVVVEFVVERGVSAGRGLETVVEVEHHLVERQGIDGHRPVADVGQIGLLATFLRAELQDIAEVLVRNQDRRPDPGLLHRLNAALVRPVHGVVQLDVPPVGKAEAIDHAGRRGHQVEIEFALEALLNDLEVEKPQASAPESQAEGSARFRFVVERGIVQVQLRQRVAEMAVVAGVRRIQAAEHDGDRLPETGQGDRGRLPGIGDRVTDLRIGHPTDRRREESHLAGGERFRRSRARFEDTDPIDLVVGAAGHHPNLLADLEDAIDDAHQDHHAKVGVVPAVDQEGSQGRVGRGRRRRDALHDRVEKGIDAVAGLGRHAERRGAVQPDRVLDLGPHAVLVGGGEIDLVEYRDDRVVVVDREIGVGDRLRLDALGGVHDQDRSLARGQTAADLVREIHVAGRVDQVDEVTGPGDLVGEAHRLRLDRDAALPLELHRVEHLRAHRTGLERTRAFDQSVRERRLAVVDVGDHGNVANVGDRVRAPWLRHVPLAAARPHPSRQRRRWRPQRAGSRRRPAAGPGAGARPRSRSTSCRRAGPRLPRHRRRPPG